MNTQTAKPAFDAYNVIAQAFNVYHETGLTPIQLADQRAELLKEMVRYLPIIERAESDQQVWEKLTNEMGIATANGYRAAIAKATGEQP